MLYLFTSHLCTCWGVGYSRFPLFEMEHLSAEKGSAENLGTHCFLALLEKYWCILLLPVRVGSQALSWPESQKRLSMDKNDFFTELWFFFSASFCPNGTFTFFLIFFFSPGWVVFSPNEPFTIQSHPMHDTGQGAWPSYCESCVKFPV